MKRAREGKTQPGAAHVSPCNGSAFPSRPSKAPPLSSFAKGVRGLCLPYGQDRGNRHSLENLTKRCSQGRNSDFVRAPNNSQSVNRSTYHPPTAQQGWAKATTATWKGISLPIPGAPEYRWEHTWNRDPVRTQQSRKCLRERRGRLSLPTRAS